MKNFILTLVIAIVSSVNVFGQPVRAVIFVNKTIPSDKITCTLQEYNDEDQENIFGSTNGIIPDTSIYKLKELQNIFGEIDNTFTVEYNEKELTVSKNGYIAVITFAGYYLSVGSQPEVSNLLIYPNPVQDVLNIKFDSYETVDVVVTDLNGRIVFNETSSVSVSVDLSNQPSGIYLVKVGSETRKVVKQ